MKILSTYLFLFWTISFFCYGATFSRDVLFQYSTINALGEGVYSGEQTFRELKKYGDFGIGTFNDLDGEMIGIDGKFYQIKGDGTVCPVPDKTKTPFAMVTFFEADKTVDVRDTKNFAQLTQYLDSIIPTKNIFYAIKIHGVFRYVKTRSVFSQAKPYPKLVDALKNQSVFEFNNVEGTIVGFRCPDYASGVNVSGYHFHFITKDRKAGGHLLECDMQDAKIQIDYTTSFYMVLPAGTDFYNINILLDKQKELEKVEK